MEYHIKAYYLLSKTSYSQANTLKTAIFSMAVLFCFKIASAQLSNFIDINLNLFDHTIYDNYFYYKNKDLGPFSFSTEPPIRVKSVQSPIYGVNKDNLGADIAVKNFTDSIGTNGFQFGNILNTAHGVKRFQGSNEKFNTGVLFSSYIIRDNRVQQLNINTIFIPSDHSYFALINYLTTVEKEGINELNIGYFITNLSDFYKGDIPNYKHVKIPQVVNGFNISKINDVGAKTNGMVVFKSDSGNSIVIINQAIGRNLTTNIFEPLLVLTTVDSDIITQHKVIRLDNSLVSELRDGEYLNFENIIDGLDKLIFKGRYTLASNGDYLQREVSESWIADLNVSIGSISNIKKFEPKTDSSYFDKANWRHNFPRSNSQEWNLIGRKSSDHNGYYVYTPLIEHINGHNGQHLQCNSFYADSKKNIERLFQLKFDNNNELISIKKIEYLPQLFGNNYPIQMPYAFVGTGLIGFGKNNRLYLEFKDWNDQKRIRVGPFVRDSIYVCKTYRFSINRPDEVFNGSNLVIESQLSCYTVVNELKHSLIKNNWWVKFNRPLTNCSDSVVIANQSTNQFSRFIWYWGDGDSLIKDNSEPVSHVYAKSGKYLVRLHGFTNWGYEAWFSDSFNFSLKPKLSLNLSDTTFCQYNVLIISDKSQSRNENQLSNTHLTIDQGNGDVFNKTFTSKEYNVNFKEWKLRYNSAGTFLLKAILRDSFCSDTFHFSRSINILPSPKPGMQFANFNYCTPLDLPVSKLYNEPTDSVWYQAKQGNTLLDENATEPGILNINQPGKVQLYQILKGPTGCITRDTAEIDIKKGFDPGFVPTLTLASHLNNSQIEVNWPTAKDAVEYTLYLQNNVISQTPNTQAIINLERPVTGPQEFYIQAINQCAATSPSSNIGRTVFLSATNVKAQGPAGEASLLTYTPYQDWPGGVQSYELQSRYNAQDPWQNIYTTSDTSYTDADYLQSNQAKKCYRVQAIHSSGLSSYSNDVCLPYKPLIFVPDAFSPNGDGLNDTWTIQHMGFETISLNIFNRWGQEVYSSQNKKINWSPSSKSDLAGVYAYNITATDAAGKTYRFSGTVNMMK